MTDTIDISTLETLLSASQLAEVKALLSDENKARQLLEQVEPAVPWWCLPESDEICVESSPVALETALIPSWDSARDASKLIFNATAILCVARNHYQV